MTKILLLCSVMVVSGCATKHVAITSSDNLEAAAFLSNELARIEKGISESHAIILKYANTLPNGEIKAEIIRHTMSADRQLNNYTTLSQRRNDLSTSNTEKQNIRVDHIPKVQ